jgi:acetyltransferase-like isoleucine patch superfamily enzyme
LERLIKIGFNVFKILFKINLWKTFYFNFKNLPFKQAIKLPFHFHGKVELENLQGKIILDVERVSFGMIVFGGKHEVVISSNVPTRIHNSGKIVFKGEAKFARGINLMVWKNGSLEFGKNFSIGSLSRIICFREIIFKNNVLISWESQFFDTDFHFINYDDIIKDNCGNLSIEDNVWIGSRVTILKNTTIPIKSIVASNAVCSGDYKTRYGQSLLLAGVPAKMIKSGVSYIMDKKYEMELFDYFNLNKNESIKCQS